MRVIVTAPNYTFGQNIMKSAPAGISVVVGYQSAYSPNANVPARTGKKICKPMEQEENHEKGPRRS
jgi:hypothetical protein